MIGKICSTSIRACTVHTYCKPWAGSALWNRPETSLQEVPSPEQTPQLSSTAFDPNTPSHPTRCNQTCDVIVCWFAERLQSHQTCLTSEYIRDIVRWRKCGADRRKSRVFRRPIAARFSAVRFRLLRRTEASTRRPLKPQTTLRYARALRRGKKREKPQIVVKITKTRTFWVGSRSPGVVAIVEWLVVERTALLRAQVHPFLAFLRWKTT